MSKYDESQGVWRTVGGRRIFIKEGQDLASAMKESGKFKSAKKKTKEEIRPEENTATKLRTADNWKQINDTIKDIKDEDLRKTMEKEAQEKAKWWKENADKPFAKHEDNVKKQQSDIEEATGLKVKESFNTDLYGNGKEDRFVLEDGRIIKHTTESFGQKEDTWRIEQKPTFNQETKQLEYNTKTFDSYNDMIKSLGETDKSTKSFVDEVKNYKPKDQKAYHSAKEVLLNKFNQTYNDGDTRKADYEKRMSKIRVLEESEDYVLYASKDDEGFVNIQTVTSWNPNSRFNRLPEVYFEQDYKGNIKAGSATVNWGAYGSQNPETTKEFIDRLTKAQQFADKINKGKNYSKLWDDSNSSTSNNSYKNAYEEYKKKHPNTKLSYGQFVDMSEGK